MDYVDENMDILVNIMGVLIKVVYILSLLFSLEIVFRDENCVCCFL